MYPQVSTKLGEKYPTQLQDLAIHRETRSRHLNKFELSKLELIPLLCEAA
jgi:hypothetical protein